MDGLKPCPFCGKKAFEEVVSSNSKVVVRIRCGQCETVKTGILSTVNTADEVLAEMRRISSLWNTRAEVEVSNENS